MNKAASIALLSVGVLLLVFGIDGWHSVSSGVSRFFTGTSTDRTVGFLVAGLAAVIAGSFGFFRGSKP